MSKFYTIKAAADYLGVEYKTVWRLVNSGELPAIRIGRVYRIDEEDLNAFLAAQQTAQPRRAGSSAEEHLLCSHCGRVIPSVEMIGGFCEHESCEESLCLTCWRRGQRYCRTHEPSAEERLRAALVAQSQGQVDRVVTALEARQRELAFISRFDAKVFNIAALQHPVSGEFLQVNDWQQFRVVWDESHRLMELLGVAYLERSLLARMPINSGVRFAIPSGALGRNRPRQGIVLEVQCISDLEAHVQRGMVTTPSNLTTLLAHLQARIDEVEQTDNLLVVALAATAGWDQESVQYVSANLEGRSFWHRLLLPLLIDLQAARLHYNVADQRLRGFVGIFTLTVQEEEVRRVAELIKEKIKAEHRQSGVTLNEIIQQFNENPGLVRRAFERLAEESCYRLMPDQQTGGILLLEQ
jgi:excisionase family DNA binding protein